MDLSKFSTSDLEALRERDLSKVSTEGLLLLKQQMGAPAAPEESGLVKFGKDITRQVGLTARYGMEGAGGVVGLASDPIAGTINAATGSKLQTASGLASSMADMLGLPKPENATERIVGEGAKLMAGGAGGIGAARQAAKIPGILGAAGSTLSQAPTGQLTAAAGGGMAGKTAEETGQSWPWQVAASLAGTVAGGAAPGMLNTAKNSVTARLPAAQQQIEGMITTELAKSGIDYSKLAFDVREAIKAEVTKAKATGGTINPDALRRLADFKTAGMTPTRGMLSLDPVQITREKNLSKITANSGNDSLRGLPELENQNNRAAIDFMNKSAGGSSDLFAAGERALGAINSRDAGAKVVENRLYLAAKDSGGRKVQLARGEFINKADELLAASNKGAFLPEEIRSMINQIAKGEISVGGKTYPVPFDVDTIDSLKTILATASRSAKDGNARAAIKSVRDALESTPIAAPKAGLTGNQVVAGEVGAAMQQADTLPQAALDAFDKARKFARVRRTWQESSKGVEAAIDGATPDKFIEKFFLKGTVDDAAGIAREIKRSPDALAATRQAVINSIKAKSLNNASDEVGKFSQSAYNKELMNIGDRKLSLLFSKDEIAQLRALGRAGSYAQAQPVGSAVNNSNSGALVMGKLGDSIEGLLKAVPFGGGLADLSKGARISLSTKGAKNASQGLLSVPTDQRQYMKNVFPLTLYGGGLLAAP